MFDLNFKYNLRLFLMLACPRFVLSEFSIFTYVQNSKTPTLKTWTSQTLAKRVSRNKARKRHTIKSLITVTVGNSVQFEF